MKRLIQNYALLLGLAAVIVGIDQWSKYLVRTLIPFGGIYSPWEWLVPYARIVHWNNTGAAFGMFQGNNTFFSILAVIVSLAIIYYYPRVAVEDWPLRVAMGLQLGGALGNLVDRILLGQVTDFISVGNFAVFNVADASITVGVIVLLIGVWTKDWLQNRKKSNPAEVEETIQQEH